MSFLRLMFSTVFVSSLVLTASHAEPAADEAAVQSVVEAKIANAMKAAPPQISADATVMDEDGTILREGTNGWICMPSLMGNEDAPMCNDETWMGIMAAMGKGEAPKIEKMGISYMLLGDINTNNDDPTDTTQDEGEPWVQEGPHLMIAVPDVSVFEGMPREPNDGKPYVMWGGTPFEHIMVPIAARP